MLKNDSTKTASTTRATGPGKKKGVPTIKPFKSFTRLRSAVGSRSTQKELGESHRILSTRLEGSLERIISSLSPGAARRALEAPGPVTTIVVALEEFLREHPEALITDPDALNATRLAAAKQGIIEMAGGLISTSDAAEILGISPSAVRKRIERGQLLSIPSASGEHRLPRVQFRDGTALAGVEAVLMAMHIEDPWMRTQLFLEPDVIGSLRDGRVEDAVRAVRGYLPRDEGMPAKQEG